MSLQQQQQKAAAQNNNGGPLQKTPPKSVKFANGSATGGNGIHSKSKKMSDKEREKVERESIVLWYHPIQTVKYSAFESLELLRTYGKK